MSVPRIHALPWKTEASHSGEGCDLICRGFLLLLAYYLIDAMLARRHDRDTIPAEYSLGDGERGRVRAQIPNVAQY